MKQFQKCVTTSMEIMDVILIYYCIHQKSGLTNVPLRYLCSCSSPGLETTDLIAENNSFQNTIQPTLKFILVRDVTAMHACTSYQWSRSMFAWCHCRCESNQGCTSHTRISQSNLFSSFLLCAPFTHLCTGLHRCMCTLWHPENMHALSTCAWVKLSWSCSHACCEIRTQFTFLNCSLIWCDWCALKTS
jgi:hypothetical protein